jgi:hypothetical protein
LLPFQQTLDQVLTNVSISLRLLSASNWNCPHIIQDRPFLCSLSAHLFLSLSFEKFGEGAAFERSLSTLPAPAIAANDFGGGSDCGGFEIRKDCGDCNRQGTIKMIRPICHFS